MPALPVPDLPIRTPDAYNVTSSAKLLSDAIDLRTGVGPRRFVESRQRALQERGMSALSR
jgi:hypothetical protein